MSALADLLDALGLSVSFGGHVKTEGVESRWTQDLEPIGEREVAAGELVELHSTLAPTRTLADTDPLRFDVLDEDVFVDDDIVSLAGTVTRVELTPEQTLAEAVDAHRAQNAANYEQTILVVRDPAAAPQRRTHVIGWWRTEHTGDLVSDPELYFIVNLGADRDATETNMAVTESVPGVAVRLHGTLKDAEPADAAQAQAVPDAKVTLGGRSSRSTPAGRYVIDARLAIGQHELVVERPGIDTRRLRVTVSSAGDGRLAVITDPATNTELTRAQTTTAAAVALMQLDLRFLVHKLRGTVTWPDSRNPAAAHTGMPVADRRVCVLQLAAGPTAPQRPASTRAWDALRRRPEVRRSARPGRPLQAELTAADGQFEVSFVDLSPGAQHLVWVESADPRTAPATEAPEVIVRTKHVTNIREMSGQDASQIAPVVRHLVDSEFNLTGARGVGWTLDAIRVVDWEADPANPDPNTTDLRVIRPSRLAPDDFDRTTVGGAHQAERLTFDNATKRVTGLVLQSLPLVPVDETPDRQGAAARAARAGLEAGLETDYDRAGPVRRPGHLLGGLRWVLDLRRVRAQWNDATTAALLDDTFLTAATLPAGTLDNANWRWWVIDTCSLADTAPVWIPPAALYAGRQLRFEYAPVLRPAAPRLLGLFERRHLYIGPGHGLFADPPFTGNLNQLLSNRQGWAARAGEDENAGVMAMEVMRIALANGIRVTSSREAQNPHRDGVRQTAANTFVPNPDFPRLWQQNAYYFIGHVLETPPPPNQIVMGALATNNANGTKNGHGITARVNHVTALAGLAAGPVDIFLSIHSNAAGAANTNGTMTMYLDRRPNAGDPDPGTAGYVETNLLGRRYATLIQSWLVNRCRQNNRNGALTYWQVNGNETSDLTRTLPHFHAAGGGVQVVRAQNAGGGLVQQAFPREIPVALSEVGFHTGNEDSLRLARRWFRRRAAEAMSMATEEMLGEITGAVRREDVKAVLRRAFGSIPAVQNLAGGNAAATAANLVADVNAAAGTALAAPGNARLGSLVAKVEQARDAQTRLALATALRDAIARVAGYDPAAAAQAADIDRFVAAPMIGTGIAQIPRGDRAPTRAEAAGLVGLGIGLHPADLATLAQPVNGTVLIPATAAGEDERYLTTREATDLTGRVAALRPQDVYRLASVALTDKRNRPLAVGAPPTAAVRSGNEVLIAAETLGTAWRAGLGDVTFRVRDAGGNTVATLGATVREPGRLVSAAWKVDRPVAAAADYRVTILVRHPRAGALEVGTATVRLQVV